ncbi:MAG: metal ABC transporter permease, partial [Lachnospiraceae bacterium]|nr:metal ABC transporter permease [Lachnospiraceae bacterium]
MEVIKSLFEYEFIIKAFEVGIIVSLCSALLGVSLVLKRYSMIGDGLSHVSFGAISIAVAFGLAPLAVSVPVVVVAAFLLLHMRENGKMKGDAAIAAMSASALAIGVTVTSLTTGMTTDVSTYMFGSILAMTDSDVILSILLSIMVLILFIFCYHKIFAVTFDESFSKATGVNVSLYNTLVAILTAVTIVLGMRMMGAMLISSLIIFPALSSMRIFKSFLGVVLSSGVTAVVCFCIGMIVSYRFSTPVGASIVIINLCVFFICC